MPDFSYERRMQRRGFECVGGVDEAGRGPLAGPVVAACVILKKQKFKARIDDSKKLSNLEREKAYLQIIKNAFIGIGVISESIIDEQNILKATNLAMERAIYSCINKMKLNKKICFLIDGRHFKLDIPFQYKCISYLDGKSLSVACASIVAKVTRDRIMQIYDKVFPQYGFALHKGYATRLHVKNLKKFGPSFIHRKTFYPVNKVIN
jgi:ribonuclease HII